MDKLKKIFSMNKAKIKRKGKKREREKKAKLKREPTISRNNISRQTKAI